MEVYTGLPLELIDFNLFSKVLTLHILKLKYD